MKRMIFNVCGVLIGVGSIIASVFMNWQDGPLLPIFAALLGGLLMNRHMQELDAAEKPVGPPPRINQDPSRAVPPCPQCGSGHITRFTERHSDGSITSGWWCWKCDQEFDLRSS